MRRALQATADFYIANTASDGIPYWDTGAPGLDKLGDWRERPADPFNDARAGGQLRRGHRLPGPHAARKLAARARGDGDGERYLDAGLAVLSRLLEEPYLSTRGRPPGAAPALRVPSAQRLGHGPAGPAVPCGESSMWGDYHLREAALYAQRMIDGGMPLMFWRGRNAP